MHRLGRLLLGAAGVLVLLVVVGVGRFRGSGPLLAALALGAGAVWAIRGSLARRAIVPSGWTPAAAVAFEPAARRPDGGALAVPMALARVEARELTTATSFGVGLGFCALALFLFGWVWAGDYEGDLPAAMELSPILMHPLAGMVVLGAFRARTRGQRDGVEELFGTCPASQSVRTLGHLLTGWAPALTATVSVAVLPVLIMRSSPITFGSVGGRQVAAVLGAGLLCIGATALGVALARWAPWTPVPVVAVVAIGFATAKLATWGTRTTEPVRQLSTWLNDPENDLRLTAPHWLAHHVWILALVAVVAVLAVLRDRRSPILAGAGLLAVALAVGAGIAATRPIDRADARRIAALVGDPARQPCVDAGGLAVCTYQGDDRLAAALADAVRPVAAAAPPGALEGWAVRQGASTTWADLDPEVRALLDDPPARDDHLVPIKFTGHPLALEALRVWSGLAATGVLDDWVPGTHLSIGGQARGTIALWLATRGADPDVQQALTSVARSGASDANVSRPWPDTCFAGPIPVRWAETDVVAARALLALPEDQIQSVLQADWSHWTSAGTSTDELLDALGLEPIGQRGLTAGGPEC